MSKEWFYDPETRLVVDIDASRPERRVVIARDVHPGDGPLIAEAPAMAELLRTYQDTHDLEVSPGPFRQGHCACPNCELARDILGRIDLEGRP